MILLFVSFAVFAQGGTPVKKDTAKRLKGVSFEQLKKDLSKGNPLFFINGDELKDSLSNDGFKGLRSEDVLAIDVLKPVDAIKIYGEKGKNGAVLISTNAGLPGPDPDAPLPPPVGQTRDTIYKDTSKFDDKAIFVVDGVLSDKKLNGINPADIFNINILKEDKASQYFEDGAQHGVVIITTKTAAKSAYQKKLGAHCKKYKDYLQTHQSYDDDFCYMVDGVVVTGKDSSEVIKKLYDIPGEKIKSVDVIENTFRNGNKEKQVVTITTQK